MIDIKEVEEIHNILIEKFGGAKGIRDAGILESAIGRPYQTFDGKDLYPEPIDKAAAIFESLISNHPFVDGNKSSLRTYATDSKRLQAVYQSNSRRKI